MTSQKGPAMAKSGTESTSPLPEESSRPNRQLLIALVAVVVTVMVGAIVWLTAGDNPTPTGDRSAATGVRSFELAAPTHVEGKVAYAQTPPVGGDHNQVWLNCGLYREVVAPELAVHSLEHGAAWITYQTGLASAEVDKLAALGQEEYTLVSPYEGLDSPIVASSWGKQVKVTSADDPALAAFLNAHRQGPGTPEPGAPCTGGEGSPE